LFCALCCSAVPLRTGLKSIARAKLNLPKAQAMSQRHLPNVTLRRRAKANLWMRCLVLIAPTQRFRNACTIRAIRKSDTSLIVAVKTVAPVALVKRSIAVSFSMPRRATFSPVSVPLRTICVLDIERVLDWLCLVFSHVPLHLSWLSESSAA
jgi:hypothetical protein